MALPREFRGLQLCVVFWIRTAQETQTCTSVQCEQGEQNSECSAKFADGSTPSKEQDDADQDESQAQAGPQSECS